MAFSKRFDLLVQLVGYSCVVFSIISLALMSSPWLVAQALVVLNTVKSHQMAEALENSSTLGGVLNDVEIEKLVEKPKIDKSKLPFSIVIPTIGVDSKVIANVDPADKDEYEAALKQGVSHTLGSSFPGDGKMIYIFGHSTDYAWNVETYNALFYQVKDLEVGDEVVLILGDVSYEYRVTGSKVIAADDVDYVNGFADQDVLLLQTCYPPGTTWQRLIVTAEPI